MIRLLAKTFGSLLDPIVQIVDWLAKMMGKLDKAAKEVGDFIAAVNPLKGLKIPSFPSFNGSSSSGTSSGTRAASGSSGSLPSGIVINITGDPLTVERTVVRALRTYSRRNGGLGTI